MNLLRIIYGNSLEKTGHNKGMIFKIGGCRILEGGGVQLIRFPRKRGGAALVPMLKSLDPLYSLLL